MIEDLFGNIGQQQEQLKKQLDTIELTHGSNNGAVSVQLTASKKIRDISIDITKIKLDDSEQLEDILIVTLNEALDKADALAAEKTQHIISDMLPPGFGNMFGL